MTEENPIIGTVRQNITNGHKFVTIPKESSIIKGDLVKVVKAKIE